MKYIDITNVNEIIRFINENNIDKDEFIKNIKNRDFYSIIYMNNDNNIGINIDDDVVYYTGTKSSEDLDIIKNIIDKTDSDIIKCLDPIDIIDEDTFKSSVFNIKQKLYKIKNE